MAGIIVTLDHKERGQGEQSAIQELSASLDVPVQALVDMDDLIDYLKQSEDNAEYLENMQAYRSEYGV